MHVCKLGLPTTFMLYNYLASLVRLLLQQATEAVEYALATGPEPFLWTPEIRMPWWQLQYVDVAAVAAAALATSTAGVQWCLHRWLRHKQQGRATKVKHLKGS